MIIGNRERERKRNFCWTLHLGSEYCPVCSHSFLDLCGGTFVEHWTHKYHCLLYVLTGKLKHGTCAYHSFASPVKYILFAVLPFSNQKSQLKTMLCFGAICDNHVCYFFFQMIAMNVDRMYGMRAMESLRAVCSVQKIKTFSESFSSLSQKQVRGTEAKLYNINHHEVDVRQNVEYILPKSKV